MNGAESLVHTLLAGGIDTCFANPGTSEMHFVAALDRIPGMRCVLGLSEGVVTGAADGYARMADRPAVTLMHCGAGLGNGIANLHNARRARTPMVNIVGDQATYHQPLDPPLTADTEGFARAISAWTRSATSSANVGADAASAIQAASVAPGQIATLILPSDTSWDEGGVAAGRLAVPPPSLVDAGKIDAVAQVLRSGEPAILILADRALRADSLDIAYGIAATTGVRVIAQQYNARVQRGRGRHPIERIPYPIDQAIATFAGLRHVILLGATPPVAAFAYPGKPGRLTPDDSTIHVLARPDQNLPDALARLAAAVEARPVRAAETVMVVPATGVNSSIALAQSVSALLPDNAVVIEEGASAGRALFPGTHAAAAHDWLQITGGAIGSGLPMATGAAIAAPGRRVVNLQADGSAMYTVPALWTQAREKLDVTTVILSNRKYAILLNELASVGANAGATALDMLDIGNPDIDWVSLSKSLGVEAARATTMEEFNKLFTEANKRRGPFLIEFVL